MSGKAVRETLGFIGVVLGLVFVGWEIRQNAQTVRCHYNSRHLRPNVSLALTTMTSAIPDILARLEGGLPLRELEQAHLAA
jgi:hypothetical protein